MIHDSYFSHCTDETAQKSLEYVQESAEHLVEYANVSLDQIKAIAILVWKMTSDICLGDVGQQAAELVLDQSMFLEDQPDDDGNRHNQKCPMHLKDAPHCDDPDCGGVDDVCQSVSISTPHFRGRTR